MIPATRRLRACPSPPHHSRHPRPCSILPALLAILMSPSGCPPLDRLILSSPTKKIEQTCPPMIELAPEKNVHQPRDFGSVTRTPLDRLHLDGSSIADAPPCWLPLKVRLWAGKGGGCGPSATWKWQQHVYSAGNNLWEIKFCAKLLE